MELHFIIFNLFFTGIVTDSADWYTFNKKFEPEQVKNDIHDDRNIISHRLSKSFYCQEPGNCTLLNDTAYCYGMKLPYSYALNSVIRNLTQEEAQLQLHYWKNILIRVPKCWAVVQPFLCASFVPKCDDNMLIVPSKTMCEAIQNPCKIVIDHDNWPFNCSSYKQDKCQNDVRELKFNTTGQCMNPLVATDDEFNYYEGIEGCGLQCQNPLFTDEERNTIQRIIKIGTIIAFTSNLFAVLTFMIDWRSTQRYSSATSILFMNICSLLVSIGYFYQFIPGITQNVICYEDGILRRSEPRFQKDLLCVTNFVFVYYFFIAGIVWFVIFAYAWNLKLKTERGIPLDRNKVEGRTFHHLAAWLIPCIFTILITAMREVDGDSLLGVCMVGVVNKLYRIMFILGPMCCSVVGIVLLMKGVFFLQRLKFTNKNVINFQGNSEITLVVIRVLLFSIIMTVCGGVIFTYHIYDYLKDQEWKQSLNNYIVCGLKRNIENCKMEHRPWMFMVNIYLAALFVSQVNIASWVVTSTTLSTWTTFIKKIMNRAEQVPPTYKRHEVISRAYAKRKNFRDQGRLFFKLSDRKKDPVGLNLELASTGMTSANSNTSWTKDLLRLITRRDALILQRRNSLDSQINISLRRVSVESRRHSTDSIVSQSIKKEPRTKRQNREKNSSKTENSEKEITTQEGNAYSTRSTSPEISELEAQVLKSLNFVRTPLPLFLAPYDFAPNLNRRSAICGKSEVDLHYLKIGRGFLPSEMESTSDYESSIVDSESSGT